MTAFVVKPTTYIAREGNNDPRVLYHQEPVCGEPSEGFVFWLGVAVARLPEVNKEATELNADGTIPWRTDANGERLYRDIELHFPIPGIDTGRPVARQIHSCLLEYDKLAREAAEQCSNEHAEAIKKWRDTLGFNKKSKLIVPEMGKLAAGVSVADRLVDDDGQTIQRPG